MHKKKDNGCTKSLKLHEKHMDIVRRSVEEFPPEINSVPTQCSGTYEI